MIFWTLLTAAGLVSESWAACSREVLQKATAAYLEAQAAGNPEIPSLSSNLSYVENDSPVNIKKGVLAEPIPIDFNRSLHDTAQCATFTEISSATGDHPYVIHTRMLLADDKITAIQSVVADKGDWAFNATAHLYWNRREKWDVIPEDRRDARDAIQAAGDAYLDSWGDGKVQVPYGTPCARLEGGGYTGSSDADGNTCHMPEFPKPFEITKRRYIVDEEVGGVDIFDNFPFLDKDKPDGTPSSNLIRVEGGKIRYIHENTVCSSPNCGR